MAAAARRHELVVVVGEVLQSNRQLTEIALARGAGGLVAHLLEGRQGRQARIEGARPVGRHVGEEGHAGVARGRDRTVEGKEERVLGPTEEGREALTGPVFPRGAAWTSGAARRTL